MLSSPSHDDRKLFLHDSDIESYTAGFEQLALVTAVAAQSGIVRIGRVVAIELVATDIVEGDIVARPGAASTFVAASVDSAANAFLLCLPGDECTGRAPKRVAPRVPNTGDRR